MGADLDPLGPHVRVVVWASAERTRTAEITYLSDGHLCARVSGAPSFLAYRVHRAVQRRAGRRPASVQWLGIRPVEQWRPVPSAPGYEASDLGRIRSVDRIITRSDGQTRSLHGRVLALAVGKGGYMQVRIGRVQMRYVHALVAEAWLGPRPDGLDVCHGLGGQQDNSPANLRYDTRAANIADSVRGGTHANARKVACRAGHALVEPNLQLAALRSGCRICRACSRARSARDRARRSGVDWTSEQFNAVADGKYAEIMGALWP
jgi:hypothetical protein